jgi:hypothetical protein
MGGAKSGEGAERWTPMAKKTSIGSIPIIDGLQKISIRFMVFRRKKS